MEWISVHQILFRARQSRKQNCHSCKILRFSVVTLTLSQEFLLSSHLVIFLLIK